MSFRFGSYDTALVAGVTATLRAWPGPSLKPETVELPDGVFYARTGLGPIEFVFDVLLTASTPLLVHALRDRLVSALSPHLGLQALTPETGEFWRWWAAASRVSEFRRGLWIKGVECQLRSEVAFTVPDGVGWAYPDDSATGGTSVTLTRTKGNLPSYPTITIGGGFNGVTIKAPSFEVDVLVAVPSSQRLVLDYQAMDFGVWQSSVKVAHAAEGMSHFDRLMLPLGPSTISATAKAGTVPSITVAANSRRG